MDEFDSLFGFDDETDGGMPEAMEPIDLDGDGITDAWTAVTATDTDLDGQPDLYTQQIFMDEDGDGIADAVGEIVGLDVDGDGVIDIVDVMMDEDGNGTFDSGMELMDSDGDGVFDTVQELYVQDDIPVSAGDAAAYESYDPNQDYEQGELIGDPETAMEVWHVQETDVTCAVDAQEFILEILTGQEYEESDLADLAQENGWFMPDGGTSMEDVGKLLEHYDLDVTQQTGADIGDIEQCLSQGGQVIVGVDAYELWDGQDNDGFGPGMDANHAVQVIGIDYSDADQPMVILNDSGVANGCGAMIPLDVFEAAWEDSGCFMVEAYQ